IVGRRGGEGSATAADDAAGGCDGVKDGAYGFHTGLAVDPWWQVDLGEPRKLGRVAVWNRGDGAGERAFTLRVLLSGDGTDWAIAYEHDGSPFGGLPSSRPLEIDLAGREGRFLRIQLRGSTYLHLDEVEVFDAVDPGTNLARGRPADQVSAPTWSRRHASPEADLPRRTAEIVARSRRLAAELAADGVETGDALADLERLVGRLTREGADASPLETYLEARWIQRRLTLRIPLLDFDAILFAKRVPGSFNHMSDQYIGWWSRPGGGLFILRDFKGGVPRAERIAGSPGEDGSVLRPDLSADAGKALFAWCRHHPGLAGEPNKLDKANVPEDAFYHIFE
ncbi:MAG: discoidin domain-containing protein, partial [Bauldia sp.]